MTCTSAGSHPVTSSGTGSSARSSTPTPGGTQATVPRPREATRRAGAAPAGRAVSVEIANESGTAVDEDALMALARHVLGELGVNSLAELSVLLVDADTIESLLRRYKEE